MPSAVSSCPIGINPAEKNGHSISFHFRTRRYEESVTFEQRVHGFVHLAEVDAEVLVLGEDVRVQRLAAQLGLVHSVGHTLVNPVNLGQIDD